jgi:hypothetical protein
LVTNLKGHQVFMLDGWDVFIYNNFLYPSSYGLLPRELQTVWYA